MDQATELAWLRERVGGLEAALRGARRELLDLRCRLTLIGRVVQDVDRVQQAPGVAVGAINAALYSEASNLRHLGRHVVRRRRGTR
ncbi:hypothetical protein [Micromonospora chokoriensis]|uniref:Uncharacterized protein n=1 Tax=Micromonospora chokoriensis TaxID=356851 RepID=A0A1C4USF0_9ACTN|nr:hypothetical protein [Micromonospora chokoriensis]SCE74633.1 hypothetical protein GA0070612_0709 [Micromonospora chokoriensis]